MLHATWGFHVKSLQTLLILCVAGAGCDESRYSAADAGVEDLADIGGDAVEQRRFAVEGHWRGPEQVGNCIQVEDWWSFHPDGRFVYTVDDRNACYEQYVLAMQGRWVQGAQRQLSVSWTDPQGAEQSQSSTSAVVTNPDGLELLATQAWVRAEATSRWVHSDIRVAAGAEQSITNTLTVTGLDGGECRLTNTVHVATTAQGGGTGTLAFSAPCSVREDSLIGWDTVIPDGWEERGWEAKRAVLAAEASMTLRRRSTR